MDSSLTPHTLRTQAARPVSSTNRNACLVLIYPTGPEIGSRFTLANTPQTLGRGGDCEIVVNDSSVSRRHARIEPRDGAYVIEDQNSTNGTYVNDAPADATPLRDGDYVRLGSCIFRFLSGGNVEADYHQVIYRMVIIDALTETHNRRYLMEFLERELVRSVRHRRPLSLLLIDIDHFKEVNDRHGHLAGDATLRELAARIRGTVRKDELFARFGGEEFALVLPETTLEGAVTVGERLRRLVEATPFQFEGQTFSVTVSLGVASTLGEENATATRLLQRADDKLYQAKHEGRNRVVS